MSSEPPITGNPRIDRALADVAAGADTPEDLTGALDVLQGVLDTDPDDLEPAEPTEAEPTETAPPPGR